VHPFHVRVSSQPTWRATGATVCGVWIVAALFAVPATRSKYLCVQFIFSLPIKYFQHVIIFQLFVSCVLPLCVIAVSYNMAARHLVKSSYPLFGETQNSQQNTRKNTAKVVLGLTVVFLISYVPYHLSETYFYFKFNFVTESYDESFDESYNESFDESYDEYNWILDLLEINPILKLFLSINPCLNPVALFCTSLAFREHFKRYLTCCCKANCPPADFELRRRN
jgi:hypothetical protein